MVFDSASLSDELSVNVSAMRSASFLLLLLFLFLLLRGGGVLMGREMLERPLLLLSVWEKMEERGGVERRVRVRQHRPE